MSTTMTTISIIDAAKATVEETVTALRAERQRLIDDLAVINGFLEDLTGGRFIVVEDAATVTSPQGDKPSEPEDPSGLRVLGMARGPVRQIEKEEALEMCDGVPMDFTLSNGRKITASQIVQWKSEVQR